jgi:hypothetical protein
VGPVVYCADTNVTSEGFGRLTGRQVLSRTNVSSIMSFTLGLIRMII